MSKTNILLCVLILIVNPCDIAHFYRKAEPFYAVHSTRKYFMKNFVLVRQGKKVQNKQKVPPPITKFVRHVPCCATDELSCLLAFNLEEG